jgi:hypothetical protein
MPKASTNSYYLDRKEKDWSQLRLMLRSAGKIIEKRIGSVPLNLPANTKINFERLLVDLPDIGGDQNILTPTFVLSAGGIAFIQTLEGCGWDVPTIGETLVQTYQSVYASLPSPVHWWLRRAEFSAKHQAELKAFAQFSQRREYPANWVMEYVEGDRQTFDFGCDYLECAVLKLVQNLGMKKYMPYICVGDFAVSKVLGTGLQRTQTLFCGGTCCDFRYRKGGVALEPLPFENLPEYQNRQN